MTVFKNYIKIAKSFLPTIILYTVIFTAFAVVSPFTSSTEEFVESRPNIAVVNHDEIGILTSSLMRYIDTNFDITDVGNTEDEMKDALFHRRVDYIMIIPSDFSSRLIDSETELIQTMKVPSSFIGTFVEMRLNRFFNIANVYVEAGMNETEIANLILEDMNQQTEVIMLDSNRNELAYVGFFFNFMNYTLLAIGLLVIGLIMTIYNNPNIKRRIASSPLSNRRFNFELFLGNGLFTFLLWLLYIVISIIMFGPEIMFSTNGLLLMLNALLFAITVLAMAILMGSLVKNKSAQNAIVNIIALGTSFISGAFVPQDFLGESVLSIARIFPSYWYIRNNNEILNVVNFNITTMQPIVMNLVVLLIFTIGICILTSIISKRKHKEILN